jgi:predicted ribosome quality control (RQC) complex YloA/Tae2 family protein
VACFKTPPHFHHASEPYFRGRIVEVLQHDLDRVLEIAVERSGSRHYLVIELFPKGSMILLDENRQILSMLKKMVYRGSKMAAGEKYLYHPGQLDPRTISGRAHRLLATAGQDLVRSIVRAEHGRNLRRRGLPGCGVDKNKLPLIWIPARLSGPSGPARGLS